MKEQQLDKDGLASSYLLLTALIPISTYLLYSLLKQKPHFKCNCNNCISKKFQFPVFKALLTSFSFVAIAYLCRNIWTIKIQQKTAEFDPFQVLNVTPEDNLVSIKKNYRKLLKVYNKKLNKKNLKEEATEGIKNLNRAFTILKDPKALSNWMTEGTTKELLIAIPSFILNFTSPVLIFYILIISIGIPLFFLLKHLNFKKISFSGSQYSSNEHFYDEINNFSEVPFVIINQCIFLMGKTVEFSNKKWNQKLPEDCVKTLEMEYGIPVMDDFEGYLRILMYLIRKGGNIDDIEYIRSKCLMLIESYKKIAISKTKTKVFEALLILEKMINQAVFNSDFYLLQYPGISYEDILKIGEPIKKSLEADKLILNKLLGEKQLFTASNVINNIPTVSISEFKAFTVDTTVENCNFENEDSKIIKKEGDCFIVPRDSLPYVQFKLNSQKLNPICHTPFSQLPVFNKWTVYLKLNDVIEGNVIVLDDFIGTKKIKIGIPFNNLKQEVKLFVVSNGYFSNDSSSLITIKFN